MGNATTARVCEEDIEFIGDNADKYMDLKNRDLTSCLYLNLNYVPITDMETVNLCRLLYLNLNNTNIETFCTKPLKSLCILCANNSSLIALEL